jgi:hypothetical protein
MDARGGDDDSIDDHHSAEPLPYPNPGYRSSGGYLPAVRTAQRA